MHNSIKLRWRKFNTISKILRLRVLVFGLVEWVFFKHQLGYRPRSWCLFHVNQNISVCIQQICKSTASPFEIESLPHRDVTILNYVQNQHRMLQEDTYSWMLSSPWQDKKTLAGAGKAGIIHYSSLTQFTCQRCDIIHFLTFHGFIFTIIRQIVFSAVISHIFSYCQTAEVKYNYGK